MSLWSLISPGELNQHKQGERYFIYTWNADLRDLTRFGSSMYPSSCGRLEPIPSAFWWEAMSYIDECKKNMRCAPALRYAKKKKTMFKLHYYYIKSKQIILVLQNLYSCSWGTGEIHTSSKEKHSLSFAAWRNQKVAFVCSNRHVDAVCLYFIPEI